MRKKTSKAQSALPYLQRLIEDDYVQDQLREAAAGLRGAYGRAARKRAGAADDKKLYDSLRRAATSIRNAGEAMRPQPAPKRRARKLLIVGAALAGTSMLARLGRAEQESPSDGAQASTAAAGGDGSGLPAPEAVATGS